MKDERNIIVPSPDMQIDFSVALSRMRNLMLLDALGETIASMNISGVDAQLAEYVPAPDLGMLARKGLRGELLFAIPRVLEKNPRLLGYYRLLLGFSQKAFYSSATNLTQLKQMEEKALLPEAAKQKLDSLCKGLISSAQTLLHGIGPDRISRDLLDDLTLLTLGPQLRGGINVRKGIVGIEAVFQVIQKIVQQQICSITAQKIEIRNAARRNVLIEFAQDPDIVIREEIATSIYRNIIAIEVKGGTDFSNIHNRIGEAEKSHQKARKAGFVECWTVVNVDRLDTKKAHQESPSTNRFYYLSDIISGSGKEFEDFRSRIISLAGIPG